MGEKKGQREGERAQGARALRAETRHTTLQPVARQLQPTSCAAGLELEEKRNRTKRGQHEGLKSVTALQHIFASQQPAQK